MGDELKTKKAFVTRDFNDSGTERAFTASTAGKSETMPEIEAGAFVNYQHAGLVREPSEADLKAADVSFTGNVPETPVV